MEEAIARETWAQISKRKLEGYPLCKLCEHLRPDKKPNDATQLHHCIIWRMKKFKKWIDVEENGLECCNECHKYAQSYKVALIAWDINLARYGTERMQAFVNSLPLKIIPAWLRKKAMN